MTTTAMQNTPEVEEMILQQNMLWDAVCDSEDDLELLQRQEVTVEGEIEKARDNLRKRRELHEKLSAQLQKQIINFSREFDINDFEITGMFANGLCEVHRKSTDEYRQYKIGHLIQLAGNWDN